jgi:hypothetical protein
MYATGEVIDFSLVTVYGINISLFAPGRPRRGCMLQAQADNYGQNMRQRWRACYG